MSENMELWNKVCKSEAKWLKINKFAKGGKLTIHPHSQVMKATEAFGPAGEGWMFDAEVVEKCPEGVCLVQVWAKRMIEGKGWSDTVTQFGSEEWFPKSKNNPSGVFDEHAPKKALTKALSKCFSYWGLNSDVYLGDWDDVDLNRAQKEEVSATLSEENQNKMITLMKEFNELVQQVDEETQEKARKFVEEHGTIEGVSKAITTLKAKVAK